MKNKWFENTTFVWAASHFSKRARIFKGTGIFRYIFWKVSFLSATFFKGPDFFLKMCHYIFTRSVFFKGMSIFLQCQYSFSLCPKEPVPLMKRIYLKWNYFKPWKFKDFKNNVWSDRIRVIDCIESTTFCYFRRNFFFF